MKVKELTEVDINRSCNERTWMSSRLEWWNSFPSPSPSSASTWSQSWTNLVGSALGVSGDAGPALCEHTQARAPEIQVIWGIQWAQVTIPQVHPHRLSFCSVAEVDRWLLWRIFPVRFLPQNIVVVHRGDFTLRTVKTYQAIRGTPTSPCWPISWTWALQLVPVNKLYHHPFWNCWQELLN